ncbi:unnamed protein product, partial [Didymodactylos carnosus]
MSGRNYPTIGLAYFSLHHIKIFLESTDGYNETIKRLKQLLLSKMSLCFEDDVEQHNALKLHTYFDPNGFNVFSIKEKVAVEKQIKQIYQNDKHSHDDRSNSTSSPTAIATNDLCQKRSKPSVMDEFLQS